MALQSDTRKYASRLAASSTAVSKYLKSEVRAIRESTGKSITSFQALYAT